MKKNIQYNGTILFLLFLPLLNPSYATETWRQEAPITIHQEGMVETIVPPRLHFEATHSHLDLELLGPDHTPRTFELYWRNQIPKHEIELTPEYEQILDYQGFVWECKLPPHFILEQVKIDISDENFIGRVDIEARRQYNWHILVKNAALYKTDDVTRSHVKIPPDAYDRFRFIFTGLNEKYKNRAIPIKKVFGIGKWAHQNFVSENISVKYRQKKQDHGWAFESSLPGSGLWIETLNLTSQGLISGDWQIGYETIINGQKEFQVVLKGQQTRIDKGEPVLKIPIDQYWPSDSLVIILQTKKKRWRSIKNISVDVRLPKLLFYADQRGQYVVRAGGGNKKQIFDFASDQDARADLFVSMGKVSANTDFKPEYLVEKYQLFGGPHNPEGYEWTSEIKITEPGFYQILPNLRMCLDPYQQAIRLVHKETQVPYFWGTPKAIETVLSPQSIYEPKSNTTRYQIILPLASPNWIALELKANGIFQRRIILKKPKKKGFGLKTFKMIDWKNTSIGTANLRIQLNGLAPDEKQLELVMEHGDNKPITLSNISVLYRGRKLFFIAYEPGNYFLTGGNKAAKKPSYDLSLVKKHLLKTSPMDAQLTDFGTIKKTFWDDFSARMFRNKNWGLYMGLGLITFIMIIIILRLFPKLDQ